MTIAILINDIKEDKFAHILTKSYDDDNDNAYTYTHIVEYIIMIIEHVYL